MLLRAQGRAVLRERSFPAALEAVHEAYPLFEAERIELPRVPVPCIDGQRRCCREQLTDAGVAEVSAQVGFLPALEAGRRHGRDARPCVLFGLF
jgi:hypothetical protein